ncbi:MAG: type II toxin-antitoxin system PemK/MazF family toxin [Candidatus Moranbacteria bacterium]|nr:type II toxin-antitoxin system PemK/MazF family toxin [Candidatus Moranbacteria bacterium]
MKTENKKEFEVWNKKKQELHKTNKDIYFRKGEIWWCSLGVNIGYEQDGKNENFERPILVLRKINRHLALVIPLSSKLKNHPYYYQYSHEGKLFSAIIFQLRVMSTKRFLRRLGFVGKDEFNKILGVVVKFLQGK